jgi:hypothetical protein
MLDDAAFVDALKGFDAEAFAVQVEIDEYFHF